MTNQKTLLVVGGGAAGFFCAINAARLSPSLKVIVVEKTNKLLSKVKVSGGGRCNVTHASNEVDDLLSAYPRGKNFMRKTLHQFSPRDTIDWFEQRGVLLKTEPDGRLFPTTNSSQTIIDCFLKEANKYTVDVQLQTSVLSISKSENGFEVLLQKNKPESIHADYLCLAAGGFSKIESFEFISKLGIKIIPPVPSLFTFNIDNKMLHQLMGVSVEKARVKIPRLKMEQEGPLLITHWGLSGPAVLKLSSFAAIELHQLNYDVEILVNWCPDYNESSMLEKLKNEKIIQRGLIQVKNPFGLSNRLWEYLLNKSDIQFHSNWKDVPQKKLVQLSKSLCGDAYHVKGKTTFKEEFVTAGGVDVSEIDPLSMQSKKFPNLFFAGEVINIDGITGGYNFQHAWSSGMIVARAIGSQQQL
jgi:predicted Rossmann fold flavoprotein